MIHELLKRGKRLLYDSSSCIMGHCGVAHLLSISWTRSSAVSLSGSLEATTVVCIFWRTAICASAE